MYIDKVYDHVWSSVIRIQDRTRYKDS